MTLSWVLRFDMRLGQQIASLIYPFDTFSMYAGMPGHDASHLLVRDAQGRIYRVTHFQTYECGEPISGPTARCNDQHGIQYHFDDLARYIDTHKGRGDLPVDLITRTWDFETGTSHPPTFDCTIAHCRVSQ